MRAHWAGGASRQRNGLAHIGNNFVERVTPRAIYGIRAEKRSQRPRADFLVVKSQCDSPLCAFTNCRQEPVRAIRSLTPTRSRLKSCSRSPISWRSELSKASLGIRAREDCESHCGE